MKLIAEYQIIFLFAAVLTAHGYRTFEWKTWALMIAFAVSLALHGWGVK